jgi:hypothetical protein
VSDGGAGNNPSYSSIVILSASSSGLDLDVSSDGESGEEKKNKSTHSNPRSPHLNAGVQSHSAHASFTPQAYHYFTNIFLTSSLPSSLPPSHIQPHKIPTLLHPSSSYALQLPSPSSISLFLAYTPDPSTRLSKVTVVERNAGEIL